MDALPLKTTRCDFSIVLNVSRKRWQQVSHSGRPWASREMPLELRPGIQGGCDGVSWSVQCHRVCPELPPNSPERHEKLDIGGRASPLEIPANEKRGGIRAPVIGCQTQPLANRGPTPAARSTGYASRVPGIPERNRPSVGRSCLPVSSRRRSCTRSIRRGSAAWPRRPGCRPSPGRAPD
jgi:hypothetical protein